jgi:glycosyltransferase involved in cell wall biosynthesis
MNKTKQTNGRKIKICFVALSAYPLLVGKNIKRIIGPDVHTTLLAKELLKHNFEITFITYSDGGAPVEHIDGIEIIKTYREDAHLNKLLKAVCIWRAMRKANAPIYYHHGGAAGVVSLFCKVTGRKLVWHIAHDKFVTRESENFSLLDRFSSWLDIKLANVIIALNEFQKRTLKKNFGKDSLLIKNHMILTKQEGLEKAKPPIVLYVGAMAKLKQPELFAILAEAIPEARFQMIGGPGADLNYYNKIKGLSTKISNFEFLGFVPFNKGDKYFSRAAILVNTSKGESYPPYAFIQAWMNSTPVITLNSNPDADEIMHRYKLGFHSKTFNQLVEDVKTLLKDETLRKEMGINGRKYVEKEHDITSLISKHIEVFNHLSK